MTTETLPAVVPDGWAPGDYALRTDRAVVELRRPLRRRRLVATGGRFIVGESWELLIDTRGAQLRSSSVVLGMRDRLSITGSCEVDGRAGTFSLQGRRIATEPDVVLHLWGRVAGTRLEIAAEFVR